MRLIMLTSRTKAILTIPTRTSPRCLSTLTRKPNPYPNFSFSIVSRRESVSSQSSWSFLQRSPGFAVSKCVSSISSSAASTVEWNDAVTGSEIGGVVGLEEEDEINETSTTSIPVRAYFFSTSVDLRSLVEQNKHNFIPPSSRMTNYVVLRFGDLKPDPNGLGSSLGGNDCCYMVVFQYGSIVLFNVRDHEVDGYLKIVERHSSGLLPEMRKDEYEVREKPTLSTWMQGGLDYIMLQYLNIDGIRTIGSVLGQSIALDYYVRQVDGMVAEFTDINRGMEKTGTFTMERKKLFQLVGKANSNLADVILKLGLFERSDIAWKDAKYAQIWEYLRDEFELTQRFASLDFKLKFVELLLSCTNFKLLSEGKQLHAQVITWSLQKNHTLVPKLVSLYAAFGLLDNAYFIVTDSHILHPFPWNILISSYVSKGHFEAIFAYEQMVIRQIRPDNFSYTYVLKACAEQSNLDFGKKVHRSINASSLNWNLFVQNALVSMYGKYGDLETARSVFDEMRVTDEVSWNSIISAYASRATSRGSQIDLSDENEWSSSRSCCSILPLARVANLQHGKEFHCYIARREEFQGYLLIWNALIEMYARSGKGPVARRLFDSLDKRDAVTYTSIVAGYGMQGDVKIAIKVFEEMIRSEIKPDHMVMIAILSACNHSGLVAQGRSLFGRMQSIYGITPNLEQFACMVDLFGRAGFLEKLKKLSERCLTSQLLKCGQHFLEDAISMEILI
ncbi:UNVERIFIED_CONTAM: Pentatricopeptide repeat-containing protein [Sesamum angustifolium]|uniref:Pentatricopeptide repeat-containing protein n=1 Tax=Sesamum angustifolium TaxID=2727405 RepID=A0AAW2LDM3_9LAMI